MSYDETFPIDELTVEEIEATQVPCTPESYVADLVADEQAIGERK